MTICLGKNNQAIWYLGMADKPIIQPTQISYGSAMNQAIIQTAKKVYASTGKSMFIIIKPSAHSIYKSLVSTLDEMNITNS
jgi:hypothetical protein